MKFTNLAFAALCTLAASVSASTDTVARRDVMINSGASADIARVQARAFGNADALQAAGAGAKRHAAHKKRCKKHEGKTKGSSGSSNNSTSTPAKTPKKQGDNKPKPGNGSGTGSGNNNGSGSGSSGSTDSTTYVYKDAPPAIPLDTLLAKVANVNKDYYQYKSVIEEAAKEYQLQPQLLVAVSGMESTFCLFGHTNGFGCMQFSDDGAWAQFGGGDKSNDWNQIKAAANYINYLVKQNGGSLWNALRSYNGE